MLLCYRYPLGDRQAIQNAYCLLKSLKYFLCHTSYICIIRPTQLDTRTPPPHIVIYGAPFIVKQRNHKFTEEKN
jgi:hypothetical protein